MSVRAAAVAVSSGIRGHPRVRLAFTTRPSTMGWVVERCLGRCLGLYPEARDRVRAGRAVRAAMVPLVAVPVRVGGGDGINGNDICGGGGGGGGPPLPGAAADYSQMPSNSNYGGTEIGRAHV